MTPSEIVRQRLNDRGVNREELAAALGVKPNSAGLMLRGKRGIPQKHYPKIAERWGITPVADDDDRYKARNEDERELLDIFRRVTEPRTRLFIRDMVARVVDEMTDLQTGAAMPIARKRAARVRDKLGKKPSHQPAVGR